MVVLIAVSVVIVIIALIVFFVDRREERKIRQDQDSLMDLVGEAQIAVDDYIARMKGFVP